MCLLLVQAIARRLFVAKSLPKQMVISWKLCQYAQDAVEFESKHTHVSLKNIFMIVLSVKWYPPFCSGLNVLSNAHLRLKYKLWYFYSIRHRSELFLCAIVNHQSQTQSRTVNRKFICITWATYTHTYDIPGNFLEKLPRTNRTTLEELIPLYRIGMSPMHSLPEGVCPHPDSTTKRT